MSTTAKRERWAAVVATLLGVGCAHAPLRAPDLGGPPWWEVASDTLRLRSNLPPEEAAALAARLVGMKAAMAAVFDLPDQGAGTRARRPEIVLFRSTREMHTFVNQDAVRRSSLNRYALEYLQAWVATSALGEPLLVAAADDRYEDNRGLRSMLAGDVVRGLGRTAPAWLVSGASSFLENGSLEGKDFVAGRLPPDRLAPPLPVAGLLDPGRSLDANTARLLVHYLRTEHPEALGRFKRSLAAGTQTDRAFQESFAGLSREQLDQELRSVRTERRSRLVRQPLPSPAALAPRRMAPAEVHALWAELYQGVPFWVALPDAGQRAAAEVQRALELDADELSANVLALRSRPGELVSYLRRVRVARPDDPRPIRLLMGFEGLPVAERLELAEAAVALDADDLAAQGVRAVLLEDLGKHQAAIDAAEAGLRWGQANPVLLDTVAAAKEALGDCEGALGAANGAIRSTQPAHTVAQFASAFDRLDRLERRCGGVPDFQGSLSSAPSSPPMPVGCAPLQLPVAPLFGGVRGQLTVSFVVLADGVVGAISAEPGPAPAELYAAARSWLRGCRHAPARDGTGAPVAVQVTQSFTARGR